MEEFGPRPVVPSGSGGRFCGPHWFSHWLVPVASSVATVVRLLGFMTFTLYAPFDDKRGKVTSCQRDYSPVTGNPGKG